MRPMLIQRVSEPESTATSAEDERTVFRSFERVEFLEWPSWVRLSKILQSNGGSYGLSGPRGAGKSWLMLRAIDDARRADGIGLWYPSPSEYEPLAFLASLSDALANEIERRFRLWRPARMADRSTAVVMAVFGAMTYFWIALIATDFNATNAYSRSDAVVAVVVGLATFTVWTVVWTYVASRGPTGRLLREAAIVRGRARYTFTLREASEFGAEGGRGLIGKLRRSREQEMVERPATLSSFVNDFRALAENAGRTVGRVVIAIDELDKMDDPEKVKELLRDVKGVFDVPHVHFLVSVSDEAARSLNLGALTGRSEFNSSFYTVIELPPVSPSGCAELLEQRADVDSAVARVLAVLAGGNPREVLRLAEAVGGSTADPLDAVVRVLKEEALNLRREIVTAPNPLGGRPPIGHDARIGAFQSLPDAAFEDPLAFRQFADGSLALWEPPWRDDGWDAEFEEPWRRLLIRLSVGGQLIDSPLDDEERLLQLRDVITAASESAAVAKVVFEERLRLETRVTA